MSRVEGRSVALSGDGREYMGGKLLRVWEECEFDNKCGVGRRCGGGKKVWGWKESVGKSVEVGSRCYGEKKV